MKVDLCYISPAASSDAASQQLKRCYRVSLSATEGWKTHRHSWPLPTQYLIFVLRKYIFYKHNNLGRKNVNRLSIWPGYVARWWSKLFHFLNLPLHLFPPVVAWLPEDLPLLDPCPFAITPACSLALKTIWTKVLCWLQWSGHSFGRAAPLPLLLWRHVELLTTTTKNDNTRTIVES